MNTTKTLVVLTPGFAGSEDDTACLPFCQQFIRACSIQHPDLKIVLVAFQYPFSKGCYRWHGITVHGLNGRNRGKLHRLLVWKNAWALLRTIHATENISGILSFWLGECALVGTRFARRHHLKHFTWMLGQDARKPNIYQWLIHPHRRSLIALSDSLALTYKLNFGEAPRHTIPLGIDPTLFADEEQSRDIDIIGVGSLIPLKRFDYFIQLAASIKRHIPGVRCVICGEGPLKSQLLQMTAVAGLRDNVAFAGQLPHQEVLRLMQRSNVLYHPSTYEGNSAVCAEALYAGAHVVSFSKPMNITCKQHHVVETRQQAFEEILHTLSDTERQHERLLTHSITDITEQVMHLFSINTTANSRNISGNVFK